MNEVWECWGIEGKVKEVWDWVEIILLKIAKEVKKRSLGDLEEECL